MPTSQPIAVFIADDHRMVREGIKTLLEGPEIKISGEADKGTTLHDQLIEQRVATDVLLLDLNMPGLEPISFVRTLKERRPAVKILAITGAPDARTIDAMLRQGLDGCMLKTATGDLLEPIRIVAQGQYYISLETQQLLLDYQRRHHPDVGLPGELSERDRELLVLIARGHGNDEIARALGVGRATINNYISRLYSTIGVQNRSQATTWAIRHGLVSVDDTQNPDPSPSK